MPSKGINFSAAKSRTKSSSLSSNPRTAATRKWEHDLRGLSLALHRVNKAATVARGRAISKVKNTSAYTNANEEVRGRLIQEAIDEVNHKRDLKRHAARQEWMKLHGEGDAHKGQEAKAMQVDNGDKDEGDTDESSSELAENEDYEDGEEESETGSEDDEDYSEAEEAAEDEEDESDADLTQEQQEALTNKLLQLRARQSREQEAFIARLEAHATHRGGQETPDDYGFGNSR